MKLTTWNVNSLKVRLAQVLDYCAQERPDVLALQEIKLDQDMFPQAAFATAGLNVVWSGQKTYNGVALMSPHALEDVRVGIAGYDDPQRRVIAAVVNGVRVVNVYCVNGESPESAKFVYKQEWFHALTGYLRDLLAEGLPVVLLGDFNIAPEDEDVYDPVKWQGKILCTDTERALFRDLLDLGLTDTLAQLFPQERPFTWWDYRTNRFDLNRGIRIDHILCSAALLPHLQAAGVHRAWRALERPSDHAPVWAEFAWGAGQ